MANIFLIFLFLFTAGHPFLVSTSENDVTPLRGQLGQGNSSNEVYRDNWCTITFNPDIDKSNTKWLFPFFSGAWRFVREKYGYFGGAKAQEGRLVGEFRAELVNRRATSTYTWARWDDVNKLIMDIGSNKKSDFYDDPRGKSSVPKDKNVMTDLLAAMADLVLFGNNRVNGAITQDLVDAGAWQDIFAFDLLTQLGYGREADDWKKRQINRTFKSKTVKGDKTVWMKDWWLPLYEKYGKTDFLTKFFQLTSVYWVKQRSPGNGPYKGAQDSYIYDEKMSVGGFVHFMSGAAGKDLRTVARTALGWNQTNDAEFMKARQDYPELKYS